MVLSPEQEEVVIVCQKHGEYGGKAFRLRATDPWSNPPCPQCEQEKKAEEDRRLQALQQEESRKHRERETLNLLHRSGIPPRFTAKTLAFYEAECEAAKKALDICFEYATNFPEMQKLGSCMVLCGKPGTGKTHLACGLAHKIMTEHMRQVVYMPVFKAFRKVKETYRRDSDITEQQAIDSFVKPALLILDEIGVQHGTDTEKQIMFEIINARYENLRPTIVISNLNASELTVYLGERAMDRMKENGGRLVVFNWQSHRSAVCGQDD